MSTSVAYKRYIYKSSSTEYSFVERSKYPWVKTASWVVWFYIRDTNLKKPIIVPRGGMITHSRNLPYCYFERLSSPQKANSQRTIVTGVFEIKPPRFGKSQRCHLFMHCTISEFKNQMSRSWHMWILCTLINIVSKNREAMGTQEALTCDVLHNLYMLYIYANWKKIRKHHKVLGGS